MTSRVTGSRRWDLALFVGLAALILIGSLRLAVYYRAPAPSSPLAATSDATTSDARPTRAAR